MNADDVLDISPSSCSPSDCIAARSNHCQPCPPCLLCKTEGGRPKIEIKQGWSWREASGDLWNRNGEIIGGYLRNYSVYACPADADNQEVRTSPPLPSPTPLATQRPL